MVIGDSCPDVTAAMFDLPMDTPCSEVERVAAFLGNITCGDPPLVETTEVPGIELHGADIVCPVWVFDPLPNMPVFYLINGQQSIRRNPKMRRCCDCAEYPELRHDRPWIFTCLLSAPLLPYRASFSHPEAFRYP